MQRLAEAVATGVLAAAAAGVLNVALQREVAARLYDAIIMARPGRQPRRGARPVPGRRWSRTRRSSACPGGRAGGTRCGWPSASTRSCTWRHLDTTILSFLITLLVGRAIGLAVRYVAGSPSQRPSATEIAAALNSADRQVTEIAPGSAPAPGAAGTA